MRKFILIGFMSCIIGAGAIALYRMYYNEKNDTDPVKLENSIIIHGITMTSDTPPSDSEDESDGQIIYDDAFDDAIKDFDRLNKKNRTGIARSSVNEFDRLRAKDKRWHLRRYKIKKMITCGKLPSVSASTSTPLSA